MPKPFPSRQRTEYVPGAGRLLQERGGRNTGLCSRSAATRAVKGLRFVGSAPSFGRQGRRPAPHLAGVEAAAQAAHAACAVGGCRSVPASPRPRRPPPAPGHPAPACLLCGPITHLEHPEAPRAGKAAMRSTCRLTRHPKTRPAVTGHCWAQIRE